ncbi:hypothetical protein BH10BAC3_BH10BAC3_39100 [soil metagenome]
MPGLGKFSFAKYIMQLSESIIPVGCNLSNKQKLILNSQE